MNTKNNIHSLNNNSFYNIIKDMENFKNKYKNRELKKVFKALNECPRTLMEIQATTLLTSSEVRSAMVQLEINRDLFFIGVKSCNVMKFDCPLFTADKNFFDYVIQSKSESNE